MSIDGNDPSHIPVTVVIPEIVIDFSDTDSIFAKTEVVIPELVKATIFPTVAIPTKLKSEVDTVEIPENCEVILTNPILTDVYCFVSAVKVVPDPVTPYKDFTSFVPYEVTAVATLLFSIPSKMNLLAAPLET